MPYAIHSHPWRDQRHHDPDGGFRNIWEIPREVPALKAFRWMLGRLFRGSPTDAAPVRTPDVNHLSTRPEGVRLTWLGHSAVYLQTPTLDVLLDPMLGVRASPTRLAGPSRAVPLPLLPRDLPGVDLVLFSHDHYDHLDRGSVEALRELFRPHFIVPLGVDRVLGNWGIEDVVAMDWHQYIEVDGGRFHCVPARHFSGRGLHNRDTTLWSGWYLELPLDAPNIYYAGDTAYADHFTSIREQLGAPDVALLPIGAYRPRWFMRDVHVDPEEAVQACLDLQADHLVPVHWGTFDLSDETLGEPPRELQAAAKQNRVAGRIHVLDVGASLDFPHVVTPRHEA